MELMKKTKTTKIISIVLAIIVLIIIGIYAFNERELKESFAETILKEKFELCVDIVYPREPYFKWAEESVMIGEYYCTEILDYEEVCDKYFTDEIKDYYDSQTICVIFNEGKAYITEGGGGFSGYGGVKFENIKSTEDIIEADAIQTRKDMDGEIEGYLKSTFRLQKEDGVWKIDEFADVDDLEKWAEI